MEFNGSAFTTAAVVSGLAYGLYAFTTRGNQNQNQNQNNQRSSNFVQSMNPFSQNQNQNQNNQRSNNSSFFSSMNPFSQNQNQNQNQTQRSSNSGQRRYGGKKTLKNKK